MPLGEYARKRKFSQTPEPSPSDTPPSATQNFFCVQRHSARRLHYDLRLQIGDTLKSWAVPQGPTLDPTPKRLAVLVEDHPLDYGTFEGNIPAGNYGAGSVMLWDEGTYQLLGDASAEDQLARGDFKFRLSGKKLRGEFAIVRMKNRGKGNEWLLLKKKDAEARTDWDADQHSYSVASGRTQEEIAAGLPEHYLPDMGTPMLAISSDKVPEGGDWVYEIKWDGVRAYCRIDRGRTSLVSRKGTNIDPQYPELSSLHQQIAAREAILDGEVTVLDAKGRPSFSNIQPRIMATDRSQIAQLAQSNPAVYFAFDLLWLDGRDLRGEPLHERKRLLASILKPSPALKYSEHFDTGGKELFELAKAQELEGIIAKRASSFYENTRSRDWVKVKTHLEQEFVIVGFTEGARDYFGALVLAHYDNGKLTWVGNVGTGFDQKLMKLIHEKLVALQTNTPVTPHPELPKTMTWVKPELLCSIRFHQWTTERRLRAPVFIGLRTDIALERPDLFAGTKDEAAITADGQKLRFKNLNKVFYPAEGYTKRDLLNYYDAVAPFLIPHWKDRPLSLRRYPDGIASEGFFQKRADIGGMPDWIRTTTIIDEETTREMVVGDGRAELLYLTNLGCIDQNPWMSRVGSLTKPDFVLIDLDPYECPFNRIIEAAQLVRRKLDLLGLTGYPKTTGGDGMHIYIPVEPVYSFEMTKSFAEILSRICTAERPDLFTMPRKVSSREKGKVYFDFLQNGQGKTISAPYVPRAYPGAPVATPLEWKEVASGLIPQKFHLKNAISRFERVGDLFAGVLQKPQRLEPALEKLEGLVRS